MLDLQSKANTLRQSLPKNGKGVPPSMKGISLGVLPHKEGEIRLVWDEYEGFQRLRFSLSRHRAGAFPSFSPDAFHIFLRRLRQSLHSFRCRRSRGESAMHPAPFSRGIPFMRPVNLGLTGSPFPCLCFTERPIFPFLSVVFEFVFQGLDSKPNKPLEVLGLEQFMEGHVHCASFL